MSAPDYVEVSRTAHQLAADHGHNAYPYAARLAREADADGKPDEAEFWKGRIIGFDAAQWMRLFAPYSLALSWRAE